MTKKVLVFLANGFEEGEALLTTDLLRRAGFQADLVSVEADEFVTSARSIVVRADKVLSEQMLDYDLLVVPGGLPGATNLRDNTIVVELVRRYYNEGKLVAAICAAPIVFERAGIINGRSLTSYPNEDYQKMFEKAGATYSKEPVVVDGNLITSRGVATILQFSYQLIDSLGGDSESIKKAILNDQYQF